jgi:predicted metal-dependent phosphoesterase TrpH
MTDELRIDLHVHSRASPDSTLDLGTVMEHLGAAGLHGMALTDHNTVAGHGTLRRLQERYPRYLFVPGVEVSAREGHVLVYGVDTVPPRHIPVEELVEWAAARNAVCVLAHPFRWVHGVGRRVAASAPVQGLEARNGRNSAVTNGRAELLAARRGLATTGGSDAHEARSLGRAFTSFPFDEPSVDELLERLRQGRCDPGGHSLSVGGRLALSLRNGLLRAGRGFRSV